MVDQLEETEDFTGQDALSFLPTPFHFVLTLSWISDHQGINFSLRRATLSEA